jgi:hypothetical protein
MTTQIMITKKHIDTYFKDNYTFLEKIAKYHIFKNKRLINPDELIAEAYLYINNKLELLEELNDINTFTCQYIIMETRWLNSKNNKISPRNVIEFNDDNNTIDEDSHTDDLVELELWYNDQRAKLEIFRSTITKKEDLIFFDVYWNRVRQGQRVSVREIAKHFNITPTASHILIVKMRNDINNYFLGNN